MGYPESSSQTERRSRVWVCTRRPEHCRCRPCMQSHANALGASLDPTSTATACHQHLDCRVWPQNSVLDTSALHDSPCTGTGPAGTSPNTTCTHHTSCRRTPQATMMPSRRMKRRVQSSHRIIIYTRTRIHHGGGAYVWWYGRRRSAWWEEASGMRSA